MEFYKYNPFAEKLNRPDFSYRAVNEAAYKDLLESGFVRGRAAAQSPTAGASGLSKLIADRPTEFPSFERGKVLTSYLPKTGQGYIYETDIPMVRRGEVNPITGQTIRGRHFAARPIDPVTGEVLREIPASSVTVYEGKPHWLMGYREVRAAEAGRNLMPAARRLGAALGEEAAIAGRMALRGAGRLAGPVGWAMTAYDLAQAFPAPPSISEEEMGQALRSYRAGPQPTISNQQPQSFSYYQPSFSR